MPEDAKKVFSGVVLDVYQWEQEMFDGSTKTFEKLKRKDAVTIIPIMDDGKILVTRQSQPGKKEFVAFPGGDIENDEDILEAAKRELKEEAGYEAKDFILWDSSQPQSKIEEARYVFIAKGCRKISDQSLDSGEKIEIDFIDFEEFIDTIYLDKFNNKEVLFKLVKERIFPKSSEGNLEKLRKIFYPEK